MENPALTSRVQGAGKQNDNFGGIAELLLQKSSSKIYENRAEAVLPLFVGGIPAHALLHTGDQISAGSIVCRFINSRSSAAVAV